MKIYKERLLSDIQLKRLGDHKYSCTSNSLCDALLQPWWNWLVAQVPLWLAPNLITILGLLVNILTTLILVYYSPDAKEEAPRWACFLCGFGLFVYQSLDAIDGKQARRTGNSNPLGELFDHGCDSISTVFVALSACIAVQLGHHPAWMFFQCFCAMTLFYCAHWQTYVSGTLRFGKVDVTEAQYTIIAIQLVSTLFGPSVWSLKIFSKAFPLWYSIPICTLICGVYSLYNMLIVIFTGGVGKNGSTVAVVEFDVWPVGVLTWSRVICFVFYGGFAQLFLNFFQAIQKGGCGKNGSTIAGTSVLSPIIPFCTVIVPAFIIYVKSQDEVYEKHPALYILAFGLVAAKITNKLVVAHMTKSEMDYVDISLLGPAMLFFNQYFNFFIPEHYVLWACMIFVTFDLIIYCRKICMEICEHLHVQLFRIPYSESGSTAGFSSTAHHHHGRHSISTTLQQIKSTTNSEKNGTNTNRVNARSRKR